MYVVHALEVTNMLSQRRMDLEKSHRPMSGATSTPTRSARYAPWLQRALRVKDETQRFWALHGTVCGEPPESDRSRGNRSLLETTTRSAPKPRSIWEAVEADDAGEVKRLLDTTPTLVFQRGETCAQGGGGSTVLHEAAFCGSLQVVQLVLHHVEARFPGETLRLFVNASDTVSSKTTALIAACRGAKGAVTNRLKIVQLLIHAGADVEQQDAHGDNVIHWCARTSNNVLLRWILKATDAGANAVYAENAKREKPLDIAKRQLANGESQRFVAQNVYTSLRSVDRKCNVLLKIQVVKRHLNTIGTERATAFETQWATALASAQEAIDSTDQMWKEALTRAEDHRKDAEKAHATTAAEAARVDAIQWLDTKEGKSYLKKQLNIVTEELKLEVLRGTISKPKDMKKAAQYRASETFISQRAEAARKTAIESWQTKRPKLPSQPDQVAQLLERW